METSLLLTRFALAAIFAVAGIAKFFDPPGTEKAIIGFGVPSGIAKYLRTLLPISEMLIAISLLFVQTSWYGAIAAGAMLLAFTAAMIFQFAKGNAPDCHCFGQIYSEPVGMSSILRNVAMIALAGFLIYSGSEYQGGDVAATPVTLGILLGFALLFSIGITAILYLKDVATSQQLLMRRVELLEIIGREGGQVEREDVSDPNEGLPVGALMPNFSGVDAQEGTSFSSEELKAKGLPTLFLFVSPTCNPCNALLPEIKDWVNEFENKVSIVFVTTGNAKDNLDKFASVNAAAIIVQKEREIAKSVNAFWTPTGLLVDGNGRIASRLAPGDNAIRDLVGTLRKGTVAAAVNNVDPDSNGPKHRLGKAIPEFEINDTKDELVTQEDFKDKISIAIFWSTTCPFCVAMQDDLVEWERSRTAADPDPIIFVDGDEAGIAALPFTSRIVHDVSHRTSARFGMYGTPSAVLIDETGTIISETATGAPNIWSLVGRKARSAS